VAFVGKVVGLRTDSGEIIEQDYDCSSAEDFGRCFQELALSVNTAILSVDLPIRGVAQGTLLEADRSPDSGADCGQDYDVGAHYLWTDHGIMDLPDAPSAEEIAAWRAIPYSAPKFAASSLAEQPRTCPTYAPTPAELPEQLSQADRAFVGTVVGFRRDDTALLASGIPECPIRGAANAGDECRAFWDHIVAVQFNVDASIKGIEVNRKYERKVWGLDECMPYDPGEIWLIPGRYETGLQLSELPSAAVLQSLRERIAKVVED
jgi:hypothetical protein